MLNHSKVLKELKKVSGSIFSGYASEREMVREIWKKICIDPVFSEKIKKINFPFMLPTWQGELSGQKEMVGNLESYTVFAIDGSQIYPDRHQGIPCYLVNIGTALFRYSKKSSVEFDSEPVLRLGRKENEDFIAVSNELVNCERTEFELAEALKVFIQKDLQEDSVFLFDGSLIFWHLDSMSPQVKRKFLKSYLDVLNKFYEKKILHAGFISLPKSRELVNLVRAAIQIPGYLGAEIQKKYAKKDLDYVVDSTILESFLVEGYRTILFENHSKITKEYPEHLRPYFFYFNNGTEIARVEIPRWVAEDQKAFDWVTRVVCDQCKKGYGYPVSLAESHEQAVVRNADKELFFHLVQKIAAENNEPYLVSQKATQKKTANF